MTLHVLGECGTFDILFTLPFFAITYHNNVVKSVNMMFVRCQPMWSSGHGRRTDNTTSFLLIVLHPTCPNIG